MRILFILLIGLVATLSGTAQGDFMPMLQSERTWCGVEGGWVPTPVEYWISADTMLADGTLWHRMSLQFEGNDIAGVAGWFHEDVSEGKVWMKWDLALDPGTLWFDFGLEPGESMVAPLCGWAEITCVAVEPFTWTDGTVSRRLTMQLLPDNENFIEHWIEGIGSENGPLGPSAYLCTADLDPHAACFLEDGALRHDFALDTTWLPTHPGCTDSLATTNVAEADGPGIALHSVGRLEVRGGQLHWTGKPWTGPVALFDLGGRQVGGGLLPGPIDLPSLSGILIAVLPDGRRQKIRIH